MTLSLADSTGRAWTAGRLPARIGQIYWLDQPPLDSVSRHGLARAFDEAVFYSDDARSAARPAAPAPPRVVAAAWTTRASHPRAARSRRPPRASSTPRTAHARHAR
jgi:hypothetical protein